MTADFIIVGSGPAGISCAWPLVEAGRNVLMVDAGDFEPRPPDSDPRSFVQRRSSDPAQWKILLNTNQSRLTGGSPKLRAPNSYPVIAGFNELYEIRAEGFVATGSLAAGGLSNIWGAGVGAFTDEELVGYPIARSDLAPSYSAIAARMGISGSADDDLSEWYGLDYPIQPPLPVDPSLAAFYQRYLAARSHSINAGLRLGVPRQAVLTLPIGNRLPCDLTQLCLWGCPRHSIYSSSFELPALMRHPNFKYRGRLFATKLRQTSIGYAVTTLNRASGRTEVLESKRLMLACGTIGTTRLVLDMLGAYEHDLPLISTPAMSFGLLDPRRIGSPPPERGYGLGNLAFRLRLDDAARTEIFGGIIPTHGMLASELASRIPCVRPVAYRLANLLWSAMAVGAAFFPGSYSANTIALRHGDGANVVLRGRNKPELLRMVRRGRKSLRAHMRKLGAWVLPGSVALTRPGEDIHYAGTFPMRRRPGDFETDDRGQLRGAEGLHIVDAAVLPTLPAKSHTFTMMANADRIARQALKALDLPPVHSHAPRTLR